MFKNIKYTILNVENIKYFIKYLIHHIKCYEI